ncbi:MAG: glycosyltransferase [Bacteroides sp.]|nr:glycosyltransferase [Bacteroides sp.]MCM1413130.1 glycosyltransferase [Bacteroides sp.]MCM1472128.1 glycosyltransferase [Bacteroides sp.]
MPRLFSIITITYNAADTLAATMRSVSSQTCKDFRHYIIDGASTDATVEIARQLATDDAVIISEPDRGLYDAMNKGIAKSDGQYLIFLNAGDRFHSSDTLAQIAKAIEDNGSPDVVYGQTNLVDADGKFVAPRHLTAPSRLTWKSFANGMLVCHQAFVAKRDIVGMYDTTYRFSADFDWCIRCMQRSSSNYYVGEVLIDYLNEGVTTANHKASLRERYNIMCRYYGRIPTMLRHIRFALRHLIRKINN